MKIILLMGLFVSLSACNKDLNPEVIMNKIEMSNPGELEDLIKQGKEQSEELDAYSLILLSAASLQSVDMFNAELFLYQALLRAAVDREVYPPTEKGSNSPLLALMALRQQISMAINNAEPKSLNQYTQLIEDFNRWDPVCSKSYNPGWDYENTPNLELCRSRFDELIEKNLNSMNQNIPLYKHPEYFTLLKEWQALNMKSLYSPEKELDDEFIKLQERLLKIESELGIEGEVSQMVKLSESFSQE